MFTLDQILAAHARVKSGADFPRYIQDLKALGVACYTHRVADGLVRYEGTDGQQLAGQPKWETRAIAVQPGVDQLKKALLAHQEGYSSYQTFCAEAAQLGVEKWVVDLQRMCCTYYSSEGEELLTEAIPE